MARKEDKREENERFFDNIRKEEGIKELEEGILYKVISEGTGNRHPNDNSVVTVHYRGTLINGREFDNSRKELCPAAFRVGTLIDGFRTALINMRIGDRWIIYITWKRGYGKRSSGPIPGYSTLIFDIELLGIA
ncbi:MAG: FKBP-type peptidyl-prolyl cis-trans isomerase [Bacteroidaceae bacterium]|nr:FKBP-type peptidyl-prolyl cis-trans isomerase [Bacteroidaceae bacterium]